MLHVHGRVAAKSRLHRHGGEVLALGEAVTLCGNVSIFVLEANRHCRHICITHNQTPLLYVAPWPASRISAYRGQGRWQNGRDRGLPGSPSSPLAGRARLDVPHRGTEVEVLCLIVHLVLPLSFFSRTKSGIQSSSPSWRPRLPTARLSLALSLVRRPAVIAAGLVVELHHVAVERVLLLGILCVQGANKSQSGKGHHNGGNGELSVISHHRTPSQTSQPCRTPTGGARAPTTSNTHISC